MSTLNLRNLLNEYQKEPNGLDCKVPRFCWELLSNGKNVKQIACQITIYDYRFRLFCISTG
ncbi:hypothetical protein WQ54_23080 [Bacillus sp. SA1-12]|nr:hypothetical protein WQ54_23080 [Bacillus sp. SA1-12]